MKKQNILRGKLKKARVGAGLVSAQNHRGVTLIALVITIIILLILAGVVLNLTIRKNGVLDEAEYAVEETNKQTATEKINLKITTAQMSKYAEEQRMITLKELSVALGNDNEIEYVTESSKIESTKYEVGDNPTSIYTKLNNYPYEFEINSSLQLASINGIKIATTNPTTMPAPKLLWQNPDPTNSNGFAAQTITLQENNCDMIEIYYRWSYISDSVMLSQKFIINNKGRLFGAVPGSSATAGTVSYIRDVVFNTNASIPFEDAYDGYTGKVYAKNNAYMIPIYIVGYETGLFSGQN